MSVLEAMGSWAWREPSSTRWIADITAADCDPAAMRGTMASMTNRRQAMLSLPALGLGAALLPGCARADAGGLEVRRAEPGQTLQLIVRISRGRFAADLYPQMQERLRMAGDSLIPAIKRLPGCLHYYAGLERESSTMINVSIWDSLEHANQMNQMAEMAQLGREFVELGVEFERPIINYETVWTVG